MTNLILQLWHGPMMLILAQQEEQPQGGNPLQQLMVLMLPILVVMVVMQVMMGSGSAREKKKRDAMIASLKKNDTVVTIGGIIGTFVSASEDKSEVTIKVDDNTRLKLQASAIRDVLTKKGESETGSAKT